MKHPLEAGHQVRHVVQLHTRPITDEIRQSQRLFY